MTGATIFPAWQTHILGNLSQVNRLKNFFPKFLHCIGRVATGSGKLFIGSRGIMTNQTINIDF